MGREREREGLRQTSVTAESNGCRLVSLPSQTTRLLLSLSSRAAARKTQDKLSTVSLCCSIQRPTVCGGPERKDYDRESERARERESVSMQTCYLVALALSSRLVTHGKAQGEEFLF